ncbi:hypothetical protein V6N13_006077 [Hibiscus sabdariffa]
MIWIFKDPDLHGSEVTCTKELIHAWVMMLGLMLGLFSCVIHLARIGSDHHPILLMRSTTGNRRPPSLFKYLATWQDEPSFMTMLENCWNCGEGLVSNLSNFTTTTTIWNHEIFGNIGRRKACLLTCIKGIEKNTEFGSNDHLYDLERELDIVLAQKESLWFQRSRSKWIQDSDRDTRYYHQVTRTRQRHRHIAMIKLADGNWCDNLELIKNDVVEFFQSLFKSLNCTLEPWVIRNLFAPISALEKESLLANVTDDEVRKVIFDVEALKAPEWLQGCGLLAYWYTLDGMPPSCPTASFVSHHSQWDLNVLTHVLPEEIVQFILMVCSLVPHLGPDHLR